eukprot:jgi/Ulvmu1/3876/UM018_0097.1
MAVENYKTKLGPNREKRVTRTSLIIPICVGNISTPLPKKGQGDATHDWVVYVRSPDNIDLSYIISKVQFTLHNSFAVPTRDCTSAPYMVHEQGWGEFDVGIKIEFSQDAMEPAFKMQHHLKLFPDEDKSGPKVVNEIYDELVFWEPTEALYNRVKQLGTDRGATIDPPDPVAPRYNEQTELSSLLAIRHRVAEDKSKLVSKGGR